MIQKLSISFSIILYLFCLYTTVEGLIQNVGFKLKSDIHNYKSLKSLPANLRDCVEVLNRKKVIVVSGGVMSGIGKGVTASSVGVLAKHLGLTTTAVKIDPYLNIDAGTMSPIEHGEVFVLDDGSETDLDLGNYERFLDICLKGDSNLTTGKVYEAVISKERRGEYLGKTVQIIPHITDEIIDRIAKVSKYCVDNNSLEPEIVLIELGGTIGDIESMPFVEAIRQLQLLLKPENMCLIHVCTVPEVGKNKEQKTKPIQHSVKELRSLGLSPDFIVCRSSNELLDSTREKIGLFCNVPQSHVISAYDVDNIYEVPLLLKNQNLDKLLCNRLKISNIIHNSKVFNQWSSFCEDMGKNNPEVNIVMVGKYMDQSDSYLSVMNALMHSAIANKKRLNLILVDSTQLEEQTKSDSESAYLKAWSLVKGADGIIVPGGFGKRGIEGKIAAAKFARENTIPYLGICLGFQIAVIEYARSVLGIKSATSEEFDPSACDQSKAIILMPESGVDALGGTMRLGLKKTLVSPQSSAFELYNQKFEVFERHRHRYEVNPALVANLNSNGLLFTGKDEKGSRMEILELPKATHPFFMASQFHPEYLSRPFNPAPLFLGFITAASKKKN